MTFAEGDGPMHDDFTSLFAFNRWADRRVFSACRKLTPEQYVGEPIPGWSSVRSSVVHIVVVIEAWLRGLTGEVVVGAAVTEDDLPTLDDAEKHLDRAYLILDHLLPSLTPEQMAAPRLLQRAGRTATLPPWVVLRHVVNHSTYHRGQIASKLKRFGIVQPETDFVYWVFEQMSPKA